MSLIKPGIVADVMNNYHATVEAGRGDLTREDQESRVFEAIDAFNSLIAQIEEKVVGQHKVRTFAKVTVTGGEWIDELPELIERYAYRVKNGEAFAHVPASYEYISVIPFSEKIVDEFAPKQFSMEIMMTYTAYCCTPPSSTLR